MSFHRSALLRRLRGQMIAVALLGLICASGCGQSGSGADESAADDPHAQAADLNARGILQYRDGSLPLAIQLFRRAMELDAGNAEYPNNLGMCYLRLEEPAAAIDPFKRAVAIQGEHALYHYNLGLAYRDLGYVDLMIAAFEKAIELDPRHFDALAELGLFLARAGRAAEAEPILLRASLLRSNFELENQLGVARMELRRLAEAEVSLRKSVQLNPQFYLSRYNLGVLLQKKQSYAEAEAQYLAALHANPEYFLARYNLAIVQQRQSKTAAARASLREFLREAPAAMYRERKDAEALLAEWN